jgi:Domain of unknown function (DUF4396)
MLPPWLHLLAIASLLLAVVCAAWIAADVIRHPQPMGVMTLVWPLAALFGSVLLLWLYRVYGRAVAKPPPQAMPDHGSSPEKRTPFPIMVVKAAIHCGSGCTLGDIVAEWLAFLVPGVAVWAGWHSVFSDKIFAVWVIDYVFAFGFGAAFQYFTIKPMRKLSPGRGLIEALKADTLSLTAWQVGMYGFMAWAQFYLFEHRLGMRLEVNSFAFWFMMQIAMLAGLATSYPVNWWLLRVGIKEPM